MQSGAEYCTGIKFSGAVQSFDGYTVYKMNANMGMEEQILAEGCRKGDNAARRELYDRYAGRLLAVCLRYSGRPFYRRRPDARCVPEDLRCFRPFFLPRPRFPACLDGTDHGERGARMAPQPEQTEHDGARRRKAVARHPGARPVGSGAYSARRADGVRQRIA